MQPSVLHIVIAAVIGLVTYLVASRALAEQSAFGYPRLIAAAVSILGCIGLLRMGGGIMDAVLLPSVAFAVAACLLFAWIGFRRLRAGSPVVPSDPTPTSRPPKKKRTGNKKKEVDKSSLKTSAGSAEIVHNPWKGDRT
ncbi:MAG: hypothetical protein WCK89_05495 [bacterium]